MSNEATVEEQAKALGWKPAEEFQGNPANWVDAQEFLDRGEKTFPAVQSDRRRLLGEVTSLRQRDAQREQEIRDLQENIAVLKSTSNAQARAKADEEIKDLRRQLAEARRSGDVDAEVQVEEQLEKAREDRKAIPEAEPEKPAAPAQPQRLQVDPEVRAAMDEFVERNSWYKEDRVLAGACNAMTHELMHHEEFAKLPPRERLARVEAEMRKRFNLGAPKGESGYVSKVEPSGPTVTRRGSTTGSRRYEDLPSDAKAQVMRQKDKFVGKGRAFDTLKEWQDHFVSQYDWRDS